MKRTRAWRRYKNYTKAKRKRDMDKNIHLRSWYGSVYGQPWYDNLHQYSKNTIFCSCHLCSVKTRNKGKRRHLHGNYAPSIYYSHADIRKMMRMTASEEEYYNNNN